MSILYHLNLLFALLLIHTALVIANGGFEVDPIIGDTMSDCIPLTSLPNCSNPNFQRYRTIDGTCNSMRWGQRLGAAFNSLKRYMPAAYFDDYGVDTPISFPTLSNGPVVPTPHEISTNIFESHPADLGNGDHVSALHMTFGQFVDHDITSVPSSGCHRNVTCETGSLDDYKYPCCPIRISSTSDQGCHPFARSKATCQSGGIRKTRELSNSLSSYIDASQVYSNDPIKQMKLRTLDGTGRLKMTSEGLLPFDYGSANACNVRSGCFLAGDGRVDEHIGLASFHTLFAREHNRIADELGSLNPHWDGEMIFQETRKLIGGMFQHIVYNEYLPTLTDLKDYNGYDPTVDPRVANGFSAAAYRFGHSQIRNVWQQLDSKFQNKYPSIRLQESFFDNTYLLNYGIEYTFYGLTGNYSESIDTGFSWDLKNKLFVPVGHHGFEDLTALNIQRARDHGVPDYNKWRQFCGLLRAEQMTDLVEFKQGKIAEFNETYHGSVEHIDLYPAGLSEQHLPGKLLGPTFGCIIKRQFEDIRDGDTFFYKKKGVFTKNQLKEIKKITMAKILCNNLKDIVSIQKNVLKAFTKGMKRSVCQSIKGINLRKWQDNPNNRRKPKKSFPKKNTVGKKHSGKSGHGKKKKKSKND